MMKKLTERHKKFIKEAELVVGNDRVIERKTAREVAEKNNLDIPHWLFNNKQFRYSRGKYVLPEVNDVTDVNNTTVTNASGVEVP